MIQVNNKPPSLITWLLIAVFINGLISFGYELGLIFFKVEVSMSTAILIYTILVILACFCVMLFSGKQ